MAIAKEELFAWVMLDVVITTNVDHCRTLGLCRGKTFAAMRKELRAQFKPFVELSFHQPSCIGKLR